MKNNERKEIHELRAKLEAIEKKIATNKEKESSAIVETVKVVGLATTDVAVETTKKVTSFLSRQWNKMETRAEHRRSLKK